MRFVFALMASVLVSSAAYAENPIKAGDKFSGHVPLKVEGAKDQQVPLPDGEWVVTATDSRPASRRGQVDTSTMLSAIYMANVIDGKLSATIRIPFTHQKIAHDRLASAKILLREEPESSGSRGGLRQHSDRLLGSVL